MAGYRDKYLWVVLLTLWTSSIEAWTLADRLSGRAFPPPNNNNYNLRFRSRRRRRRRRDASSLFATTPDQPPSTKKSHQRMMDFMQQPQESTVGDAELPPKSKPHEDPLADLVRCIVKAADDRKASDIVALRVKYVTTLTSFVVIVSGNSRPQNQAIAKSITDAVAENYDDMRPGGNGVPEGSAESGWILLDYGSVMVHIMAPKSRLFYNVEGQWRDKGGEEMDISDILVPNTVMPNSAMSADSADSVNEDEEDDDPFWS